MDGITSLKIDCYFAERLTSHGCLTLFLGTHTPDSRRDVIEAAIVKSGLADKLIHKAETFRAAFERAYGRELTPRAVA